MENRFLCRGKRIDTGEWVEGFLVLFAGDDKNRFWQIKKVDDIKKPSISQTVRVNPSTICQCTGLKDKNGKLIWENDICDRKEQYPEIVKYCGGDWTLDYSYASHKESGVYYCNLGFYAEERKCVEVIGNIFDNPELLEVQP